MKFAVAILAIACSMPVAATMRHVPAEFATIQAAIDASSNGDIVRVSSGTYYELVTLDREITLESEAGAPSTTIDGTYLGSVLTVTDDAGNAVIRGFTITRGLGKFWGGGVAIHGSAATLSESIVSGNLGNGSGNGISLQNSNAHILRNLISDNSDSGEFSGGGGGGGISVLGAGCEGCGAEIRGNVIRANSANRFSSGGGIDINGGGSIVIADNVITDNETNSWGGGISMVNGTNARIENNIIAANRLFQPDGKGGGVFWLTPSTWRGPFLVGNTIVDNQAPQGSGVYANGFDVAARVVNNIIVGVASSTGIECGDTNDANPPIIVHNDSYVPGGTAYGVLCGTAAGMDGNISADPMFVGGSDYAPRPQSPVIDAGFDAFVTEPTDLVGRARRVDGNADSVVVVDMGAHEYPGDGIFADDFDA